MFKIALEMSDSCSRYLEVAKKQIQSGCVLSVKTTKDSSLSYMSKKNAHLDIISTEKKNQKMFAVTVTERCEFCKVTENIVITSEGNNFQKQKVDERKKNTKSKLVNEKRKKRKTKESIENV